MEKYVALILLAAPGFIARHISTLLGVTSTKKGEFETLGSYLSYSFFAITLTIALAVASGFIDSGDSWQMLADKMTSIKFSMGLLIIALASAVTVGVTWALCFNGVFMKALNWLNLRAGRLSDLRQHHNF